ncbi:GerA spore germination protein [Thermolongibacillus altinsuensis]|uniref:GerA spore germination protein n=2 Tax=Thermolongibacillus altinsuensis TaxID=575256 RepID=A0A4R1QEK9_9BACL|nr:GerA spore germination protein [Thermolongibacillus altinsuensis]
MKTMFLKKKKIVDEVIEKLYRSPDLTRRRIERNGQKISLLFLKNLVNPTQLQQSVLQSIQNIELPLTAATIAKTIPIGQVHICQDVDIITAHLIEGWVYVCVEQEQNGVLLNVSEKVERSLEKAETESLVFGPKISFTESLSTNIRILRNNVNDEQLVTEEMIIGKRNKLPVRIVYIQDIADPDNVQTVKQRLSELDVDDVTDSSVLAQMLDDHSFSIFPQYLMTELPDRLSYSLLKGRIGILVDRSPTVIICPTTFFSFFETTEDIYLRWTMSTVLRVMRMLGILTSIFLSPIYVAVITYHYELIPSDLLLTIGESRSRVPFPPVLEALLLEFMIELLREAGARLPTKVGQTMGIVGGIVLGQAAVDAGFTSNLLIIIVSLSALGSFTAPSYEMGTAIRILRFPIIILAAMWGLIGIIIGICVLIVHLLKLTSLGRPYLSPIYPFRFADLKYSLVRLPQQFYYKRPISNRVQNKYRFSWKDSKKRKDLDE